MAIHYYSPHANTPLAEVALTFTPPEEGATGAEAGELLTITNNGEIEPLASITINDYTGTRLTAPACVELNVVNCAELLYLDLTNCLEAQTIEVTGTPLPADSLALPDDGLQATTFNIPNAALDATTVDTILTRLAAGGPREGTVNLSGGTTAGRTSASDAANTYLLANDWTVTLNPTVTGATINDLGDTLTVTFSVDVTGGTGFTMEGWELGAAAGAGNTRLFSITPAVLVTDEPVLDYTPGDVEDTASSAMAALTGVAITNNSIQTGGDSTPPTVLSASINSTGTELFLSFSETVVGNTGFDVDGWTITYVAGSGTSELQFDISPAVLLIDNPALDYTPGNVVDLAANALEPIVNGFIQNNSSL